MATALSQRGREIAGLVCLVFFVLSLLALLSFHAMDPSWNTAGPGTQYQNAVGRVGAHLADFFLQLLGLVGFAAPIPLLIVGVKLIAGWELREPVLKAFGFLALLAAAAGLFHLAWPADRAIWELAPGGVMGALVAQATTWAVGRIGAYIILTALALICILVLTSFSLERTVRSLVRRFDKSRLPLPSVGPAGGLRKRDPAATKPKELFVEPIPRPNRSSPETAPPIVPARDPEPEPSPAGGPSREAPGFRGGAVAEPPAFQMPALEFLTEPPAYEAVDEKELRERADLLTAKCAEFGVHGRVEQIRPGPVVTTFEFKPDAGVRYSRILNLAEDLCLGLRAESIRIERIPGKNTVGIEVPNHRRRVIHLREVLASDDFQLAESPLTLALGTRVNGEPFVADLSKMPHLLIAGSTGSGKSVALNCMLCSILYKASPEEVRFILVDPKRLELGLYENIPHLLTPIVTDPKQAANALSWAVREMEERYRLLAAQGVRNIQQYNLLAAERQGASDEELAISRLPNVVIIVDELADLMMTAGKDVEIAVTRLAQMARAVGIHLILATQRPSVDVITGLIKANFPSRISFRVSSKVDSRTILDTNGAEQLLGRGDMLFLSPESRRLLRIHGAYVSEKEIARIVRFLQEQGAPDYNDEVLAGPEEDAGEGNYGAGEASDDPLFEEAARFVVETRKASTSLLQRRFQIGYGRAARLLDIMEQEGIVGPPNGPRPREILVPPDYFDQLD
ncbi:MAG: DNA translocase FtsK 4TM domain-containing protein [Acidobacteriota bacterium]